MSRPLSYKTFSKTGEVNEAEPMEQHEQLQFNGVENNQQQIIDNETDIDRENVQNLFSLADHLTPLMHEKQHRTRKSMEQQSQNLFQEEELDLYVNPKDDDLDTGKMHLVNIMQNTHASYENSSSHDNHGKQSKQLMQTYAKKPAACTTARQIPADS